MQDTAGDGCMIVPTSHEQQLTSELDSIMNIDGIFLLPEKVLIPVQPNTPKCKKKNPVLVKLLIVGDIFYF